MSPDLRRSHLSLLLGLAVMFGLIGCKSPPSARPTEMPPSPTAVLNPGFTCLPTESSELDHTYAPGAPERQSVGQGYVLSGVVKSAEDCSPIPGAQIELWLPNANGDFDDAHRARLLTDSDGRYRFESDGSQANAGIPIHIRVVAEGFGELVTQHFPVAGQTSATLDLVMVPTR